jgi:hypothetical protein
MYVVTQLKFTLGNMLAMDWIITFATMVTAPIPNAQENSILISNFSEVLRHGDYASNNDRKNKSSFGDTHKRPAVQFQTDRVLHLLSNLAGIGKRGIV